MASTGVIDRSDTRVTLDVFWDVGKSQAGLGLIGELSKEVLLESDSDTEPDNDEYAFSTIFFGTRNGRIPRRGGLTGRTSVLYISWAIHGYMFIVHTSTLNWRLGW